MRNEAKEVSFVFFTASAAVNVSFRMAITNMNLTVKGYKFLDIRLNHIINSQNEKKIRAEFGRGIVPPRDGGFWCGLVCWT
jgi:hypothetical protein